MPTIPNKHYYYLEDTESQISWICQISYIVEQVNQDLDATFNVAKANVVSSMSVSVVPHN